MLERLPLDERVVRAPAGIERAPAELDGEAEVQVPRESDALRQVERRAVGARDDEIAILVRQERSR